MWCRDTFMSPLTAIACVFQCLPQTDPNTCTFLLSLQCWPFQVTLFLWGSCGGGNNQKTYEALLLKLSPMSLRAGFVILSFFLIWCLPWEELELQYLSGQILWDWKRSGPFWQDFGALPCFPEPCAYSLAPELCGHHETLSKSVQIRSERQQVYLQSPM